MMMSPQARSNARRAIVSAAQRRIGVREDGPPYDNRGREVDTYLAFVGLPPGNPWCLAFAEYCVDIGLRSIGAASSDSTLIRSGYCPAVADHARSLGVLISAEDAGAGHARVLPGDLLLVWEDGDTGRPADYHHSGIVEISPLSTGTFHSIEGNTNTDGGPEGYIVARQIRSLASVAPDGHARYAFVRVI